MKKQILFLAIIATAFIQNMAAQTGSGEPFNNIMTAYINLKNALAMDNNGAARAAAKDLYNAIDKIPKERLTGDKRSVWMKYADKLSYDSEHIKGSNDIDHQREHFMSLSKNMYMVAKVFNTNTSKIYFQFCQTANGGRGLTG